MKWWFHVAYLQYISAKLWSSPDGGTAMVAWTYTWDTNGVSSNSDINNMSDSVVSIGTLNIISSEHNYIIQ